MIWCGLAAIPFYQPDLGHQRFYVSIQGENRLLTCGTQLLWLVGSLIVSRVYVCKLIRTSSSPSYCFISFFGECKFPKVCPSSFLPFNIQFRFSFIVISFFLLFISTSLIWTPFRCFHLSKCTMHIGKWRNRECPLYFGLLRVPNQIKCNQSK